MGIERISGSSDKGPAPITFEMSLTRTEFLRLLPVAVGNEAWRLEGDEISGEGGPHAWRIGLAEMPGRRFGPVVLPVLAVTIDIGSRDETDRAAFVSRFLLGYQRAGG